MSNIGEFLRELRGNRSLREVERLSGVSHTYLSSLEKGADPRTGKERKPTTDTLQKLAEVYDHPYYDLLERAGYLPKESEDKLNEAITMIEDLDMFLTLKQGINQILKFEQVKFTEEDFDWLSTSLYERFLERIKQIKEENKQHG